MAKEKVYFSIDKSVNRKLDRHIERNLLDKSKLIEHLVTDYLKKEMSIMNIKDVKKIEELEDFITKREVIDNKYQLLFVDFNRSAEHKIDEFVGPDVFQCSSELRNEFDIESVKKEFVESVKELSNMNENENTKIFNLKDLTDVDKIKNRIKNASNYIAADGRVGQATCCVLSQINYERYRMVLEKMELSILISDDVEDMILYRKNGFDQPGLVYCYKDDKYSFDAIGFNPEKQFIKIGI